MSIVGNAVLGEVLKIALPILAERITAYATEKEPELRAYLEERFGHSNPLVHDILTLLIEPELATIGGILATLGNPSGQAPASHALDATARAPDQPWPDNRDN